MRIGGNYLICFELLTRFGKILMIKLTVPLVSMLVMTKFYDGKNDGKIRCPFYQCLISKGLRCDRYN